MADEDEDEEISEDNAAVPFPELRGAKAHTFDMDNDDDDSSPGKSFNNDINNNNNEQPIDT